MPAGRPTKLTPELQETICLAIRAGNYLETAARRAGVHKSTLYDWIGRGVAELERLRRHPRARMRKREAPYIEFSDAIKKAEADAEIRAVALIGSAATDQWQAAAWYLERKHFDRWGRKDRLEHTGKGGKPIKTEIKGGISKATIDAIKRQVLGVEPK